jgi:putative ABC transport system ATP-binding protein
MIEFVRISLYRNGKPILSGISGVIETGDFVIIVGPNGSGKTTLFDLFAGQLEPVSGHMYIDGKDVTNQSVSQRALLVSRLLQNPRSNGVLDCSVEENIMLSMTKGKRVAFWKASADACYAKVKTDLALFGFDSSKILKTKMKDLSGGQCQQIAFIMAMSAGTPKLLLLDEPTAALDPVSATTLLKQATSYIRANNVTTVMITHDPELALALGNKIWVINNGTIEKQYNTKEDRARLTPDLLVGKIPYDTINEL